MTFFLHNLSQLVSFFDSLEKSSAFINPDINQIPMTVFPVAKHISIIDMGTADLVLSSIMTSPKSGYRSV
ncbi:hypothetical protein [Streptococcus cuniculipharyngis]|uniref:Uncharacterized protein n=1 Tax=Streptococcus cuniculipharyngis TaxID=1562651 RepID=A0A5C5SE37_9STRE|nr:hypothetical protein [Streptococcus cuniculipharyngis]TWS99236.1 hypothetical protein FRX57_03290 [Streptococcus cuniculipharyngis]